MKYEVLTILGLPKSFHIWDSVEALGPSTDDINNPDDILYDAYPAVCDKGKREETIALFKYNESATGIFVTHNPVIQSVSLWLPPFAVKADVVLYATYVNMLLSKYKRARLYDKYTPLKSLNQSDVERMISDRNKYLKRLLTTKEGFTMCGLNSSFTLKVAHLSDLQVSSLQEAFVKMQWEELED